MTVHRLLAPTLGALSLAAALTAPAAFAQSPHAAHGAHAVTTSATASDPWADGEVRKVDTGAGTVTLRHGELKALNMPAMTMAFAVKDKASLGRLKVGDKECFKASSEAGTLTASEITAAK